MGNDEEVYNLEPQIGHCQMLLVLDQARSIVNNLATVSSENRLARQHHMLSLPKYFISPSVSLSSLILLCFTYHHIYVYLLHKHVMLCQLAGWPVSNYPSSTNQCGIPLPCSFSLPNNNVNTIGPNSAFVATCLHILLHNASTSL